jgi:hypothetical protein
MRATKIAAVLAILVFCFSTLALAGHNKFGVSDSQRIVFSKAVRVGDTVLPKGEYKVEHTMQGEEHIMVFTQMNASKPATTKAKCQLVTLPKKAEQTAFTYQSKGSEAAVLQELIFKGDTAKHVFE